MDQDFNLWQKLFQSKPVMRATGGLRYLFGNEQEKNRLSDLWGEDVDNSLPAIMGLTKPFRMGSNILGQYYGSALTGQDMTNQDNQGKFLQWLSSALTPEEQTQIEEKPYLNALKSSAGMASTLMPFAEAGVVGNVGSKMANPTLSKFTNLLSRGSLEGGVGGFGYSREGKELQDTLLGMVLGAGGEVLGGLISDPTFRRGMGQEIKKANTGNYEAMLNMGDDIGGDFLKSVKARGISGDKLLEVQDLADEIVSNGGKINRDGTVTLYHATNKASKEAIESSGKMIGKEPYLFFSTSPNGQISGYGDSVVELNIPLERLELDDVFGTEAHLKLKGSGIGKPTDVSGYFKPRYIGDKLPKNKDRYIQILTGEEGDENQLYNLDYKGLKKEPGRISKTHEEDLIEEMRKTAERWGLYR